MTKAHAARWYSQRRLRAVPRARRGAAALAVALVALAPLAGCKRFQRKHIPVESLAELPPPSCSDGERGRAVADSDGWIQSGATSTEKDVSERYAVRDEGCIVYRGQQDWTLGGTDLEVVYDRELRPLRIWKRMRIPALKDSLARAEIRRYELRTDPIGIARKAPDGFMTYEQLKGGRPAAVIGPGRGLLTMWIQRARLGPGQKVRELVLDVRALEKIEPVTLLREPDMDHKELGRIRVYTFYGRETVFADERDRVLGDLAGMRPAEQTREDAERWLREFRASQK